MSTEADDSVAIRDGRCEWCNGPHEGGETVQTGRGYWWHRECAQENLYELEEALR